MAQRFEGIRNSDLYNGRTLKLNSDIGTVQESENDKIISNFLNKTNYTPGNYGNNESYYVPLELPKGSGWETLGESQYDPTYMIGNNPIDILENRAAEQSNWSVLANSLIKGTALAGTTFLDGVGLLYGLGSWATTGDAGEIFNNKLSSSLREFNQYMEEALPVYRTLDEIENPMAFRNLFSFNTFADDFLKNIGFTVGAFYSGNAYLSALKGIGNLVKAGKMSSTAAKIIGSTVSGINEGRIEAGNLFDLMYKNGEESLMETYRPLYQQIMSEPDTLVTNPETGVAISSRLLKLKLLLERLEKEKTDLRQRATNAGVMDLIFNSVYLPFTDFYTYGKLYARKSNLGKDLADKVGKQAGIDDIAEQAAKTDIFGDRIVKDASGKYITKPVSIGKSALKGTKLFGVEGSEEMNLAMFESLSTNFYTPDSPDAYYKALTSDKKKEIKTKDFLTSLTTAIGDSWGNPTAYKEFLIGGLNGIIGMPTFGKVNNSDRNTWLGRGKMIGMSGGVFGEISNDAYYNQQALEATDKMNAFVDKVNNAKMFFTRSQSFTDAMDGYSQQDDKFEFQNAKDNDLFNIIDAYGRTGRIQDLLDLVNADFEDLSEERLKEIAEDTESINNEWRNVDGSSMADTEEGRVEMTQKLKDRRDAIVEGIKSYEKSLQRVRSIANNSLTEDLNAELAWLAWKQDRFTERFNSIKDKQLGFTEKLARATLAFLKGRGMGVLTLSEALVNPFEYILNEETGEIETREKTQEEKQKEVEAGQNIKKSMEVVSLFLDMINEAKSPLLLSYFVKNNPEIPLFMDNIGYDLIEGIVPMTFDEYTEGMKDLKDVARIATAHKSFSDRYLEFIKNPSKVIQNRLKIEQDRQKVEGIKGRSNIADNVRNTSVGDLARGADEGNINFDDVLSELQENAQRQEGSSEGNENLYQAEIDKVKEAQQMQQTRDDLVNGIMQDDSLSELLMNDAISLVSAAYRTSTSMDDFVDLDMEAYNDARNLLLNGDSDEVVLERLDEANNIIHLKLQEADLKREAAQDLPNSDTPTTPTVDRGTTNGRDPLDVSETELERISREKEAQDKKTLEKEQKLSDTSLWNTLTRSAFDIPVIPPQVENDIDNVIKPLVEDAISANLSDTQITEVLKDNLLFRTWNTQTKGKLGEAISQYISKKREQAKVNQKSSLQQLVTQQGTLDDSDRLRGSNNLNTTSVERGPATPDITSQTSTSTPDTRETLPTLSGKNNYLRPSMRKTVPDKEGNSLNWEDSTDAESKYPKNIQDILKKIRKYLEEKGAFDTVDNGGVKVGKELSIVVDPSLTSETGEILLLWLNEEGYIVGDLPHKFEYSFKNHMGLDDLTAKVEKAYNEWIKEHPYELFVYEDRKFKVTQNLIGKVLYTDESKFLNDIFKKELKLGLCLHNPNQPTLLSMLFDGGRTQRNDPTERDKSVMMPLKPTAGMPYVLIETSDPTRRYIPVPFRMERYNGNTNTLLGRAIHSAVRDIINKEGGNSIALKDSLLDLVALLDVYLDYNDSTNTITFRVKTQGATEFRTIVNDEPLNSPDLELKIIESLKGSPYQISRKYINGEYEFFENGSFVKVPYNSMIGEIATVNIAEGASHTQGDWFITEPAIGTATIMPTTGYNPNHTARSKEFNYNGNRYTITEIDNNGVYSWQVKDALGNVINDDVIRAFGYGTYKGFNMNGQYKVSWSVEIDVNGQKVKTLWFSPVTGKYVQEKFSLAVDLNEALALVRGEEGKDFRRPLTPLTTGVSVKVQLEIAQANADSRRERWQHASLNELLALLFPDGFSENVDESVATLDRINSEILEALNEKPSRKELLEAAAKAQEWRDKWRKHYQELEENAPTLSEVDRLIAEAVWEDRRARHQRDYNAEIEKVLESFDVTPAYSEDSLEGVTRLVITIPSTTTTLNLPKQVSTETTHKIGDNLKGLNGVWTITSMNDDGSITLTSITTDAVLKLDNINDLDTYKFISASLLDVVEALESIEKEIEKSITELEFLGFQEALQEKIERIELENAEQLVSRDEEGNLTNDTIPPTVQQVLDNFKGYFEAGGRIITDDFPGFNEQLALKFEDFYLGNGEFTEDDAIEFLNEITRRTKAKETGVTTPNPEIDLLSPEELYDKAVSLKIINNAKQRKVWDALSPELQNTLINQNPRDAKTKIRQLSTAQNSKGFNLQMLGATSLEEYINSKPKYLKKGTLVEEENTWSELKELNWLSKALPLFTGKDRLQIVDTLRTLDDQDAYGQFWKNVITIARNAVRGTLYHEAFHGVVNSLLTEQEYIDLFNAATEQYGNLSIEDLEEKLAEDFRRYTKILEIPVIGGIVKIFRRLKHFIQKLVGNEPYINKLFYDINRGKYATRGLLETNTSNYSQAATTRLQSIVDITINKDSVTRKYIAWERWKRNMEASINATIKGYIDLNGNWKIASVTPKGPKYLRVNLDSNQVMLDSLLTFLDNFNIKINDINENYTGEMPLFDALNRTINPVTTLDIPKGVGYAIAFMMLHHPEIEDIIALRVGIRDLKGFKRSIRVRGSYDINSRNIQRIKKNKELYDSYLHEIGDEIANELNKLYKGEPINTNETFYLKLWNIIKEFFNSMTHKNRIYYSVLSSYARHIANAVKLNDATIILSTDNKPETRSEANLVDIGQALIDYPYEDSIIRALNSEGIALAGGASIAISGTLYRPSENPLHDLDFNAGNITRELIEEILRRQGFNFLHFNTINDGEGKTTETYLIVDEPFKIERVSPEIAAYGVYSLKTGELMGSYPTGLKNMEFISKNGHKGKFLDFFIGKNNQPYPNHTINVNGRDYLVASPLNAFKAKTEWARVKDIWDYNRFVPFDRSIAKLTIPNEELKERIDKASIIWGHPALGKTTYLQLNQDILEWDDLINPERFKFIRNQIDPDNLMDTLSTEYRNLKSDYMASWREHPEYVLFLKEKWNWLKLKAKTENKKIMASPAPLLELFKDDFDLFITLTQKDFLARNMSRGGTFLGSLGWEQGLYDILSSVDENKIARTNSYLSDVMSSDSQNIPQKGRDKLMFGFLTPEQQSFVLNRTSVEEYNKMSLNMKEVFLHCR